MSENTSQPELVNGDLSGLPWAALIMTPEEAAEMVAAGTIEWNEDGAYRFTGRNPAAPPIQWLAAIGKRLIEAAHLTHLECRVLMILLWRAGPKGCAWPGMRKLAEDVQSPSIGSIHAAVHSLEAKGFLEIETGTGGRPNRYHIRVPLVPVSGTPCSGERNETNKGTNKHPDKEAEPQASLFDEEELPIEEAPECLFAHYLPAAITTDVPAMLALGEFAASRRERKKPLTKIGVRRLCRKIETWTPAEVTGAANAAVIAGWSDLYPPKNPAPTAAKPKQTTPDYSKPW